VILTSEEWQILQEAACQIFQKEDEMVKPCIEVLLDIAQRYLGELESAEEGEVAAIRVMSRLVNLLT
jgi:hypothetical protein